MMNFSEEVPWMDVEKYDYVIGGMLWTGSIIWANRWDIHPRDGRVPCSGQIMSASRCPIYIKAIGQRNRCIYGSNGLFFAG